MRELLQVLSWATRTSYCLLCARAWPEVTCSRRVKPCAVHTPAGNCTPEPTGDDYAEDCGGEDVGATPPSSAANVWRTQSRINNDHVDVCEIHVGRLRVPWEGLTDLLRVRRGRPHLGVGVRGHDLGVGITVFKKPSRISARSMVHRRWTKSTAGPQVDRGWVTVEDRALAVAVHQPDSHQRRGTVIIAGSIGRERVTTFRTLNRLTHDLAEDGWRVVRFDWSGTGLSPTAGSSAPAQNWGDDLEAVRRWAGAEGPVHGVGIRLGGTLMAAASEEGWATRHIWGPVSGKRWLRHHAALRRLAGSALPEVRTPGCELMDLHVDHVGQEAIKGLVQPTAQPGEGLSILRGPGIDALPVDIHPRLASVPHDALSTVVQALATHSDPPGDTHKSSDPQKPRVQPDQQNTSVLRPQPCVELTIGEAVIRLESVRVGSANRPGVVVAPCHVHPGAPGFAFVSLASEPMESPGALWMRTAAQAATRGAVSLLAARSATGELMESTSRHDPNPYTARTLQESRELLLHLSKLTTGDLHGVGVCLGAWALAACVTKLPPHVTSRLSLILVNNVAWQRQPLRYWRQGIRSGPLSPAVPGEDQAPDKTVHAGREPSQRGTRPLEQHIAAMGRTIIRGARKHASRGPLPAIRLAAATGLVDVPHPLMRRLSRIRNLHVELVFGPEDARKNSVTAGVMLDHTNVSILDPLDHSLHAAISRDNVLDFTLAKL